MAKDKNTGSSCNTCSVAVVMVWVNCVDSACGAVSEQDILQPDYGGSA